MSSSESDSGVSAGPDPNPQPVSLQVPVQDQPARPPRTLAELLQEAMPLPLQAQTASSTQFQVARTEAVKGFRGGHGHKRRAQMTKTKVQPQPVDKVSELA